MLSEIALGVPVNPSTPKRCPAEDAWLPLNGGFPKSFRVICVAEACLPRTLKSVFKAGTNSPSHILLVHRAANVRVVLHPRYQKRLIVQTCTFIKNSLSGKAMVRSRIW